MIVVTVETVFGEQVSLISSRAELQLDSEFNNLGGAKCLVLRVNNRCFVRGTSSSSFSVSRVWLVTTLQKSFS